VVLKATIVGSPEKRNVVILYVWWWNSDKKKRHVGPLGWSLRLPHYEAQVALKSNVVFEEQADAKNKHHCHGHGQKGYAQRRRSLGQRESLLPCSLSFCGYIQVRYFSCLSFILFFVCHDAIQTVTEHDNKKRPYGIRRVTLMSLFSVLKDRNTCSLIP
jgi:hypothetical protein